MTRCSAEELIAAHHAQEWKRLWEQALPIVKFTLKKMLKEGRVTVQYVTDDLLQEGNLAAGSAVRSWNPDKGAFTTWVMVNAYRGMRDHIRRAAGGMIGGRDARAGVIGYIDVTPDPQGDPQRQVAREADTASINDELRCALSTLAPEEYEAIAVRYGIGVEEESVSKAAVTLNIPERTLKWRTASALKKLARIFNKSRYLSEHGVRTKDEVVLPVFSQSRDTWLGNEGSLESERFSERTIRGDGCPPSRVA